MFRKKISEKVNIPMLVAFVLFCLTVISSYLTTGLYAKYAVRSYNEDSATVAYFRVTESRRRFSEELVLSLSPGIHETAIEVTNGSDVAIKYTITIENLTNNIPLLFEVEGGDGTLDKHAETFFMEADTVQTYTLKIIWPQEGSLDYMGMVDLIKITLRAEQIN